MKAEVILSKLILLLMLTTVAGVKRLVASVYLSVHVISQKHMTHCSNLV